MCARRFLAVVFVFTLLAVAGAFAIFQWGGSALLSQAAPQGPFRAEPAGDAPDYAELRNWIDRPGVAASPSLWRPTGAEPPVPGEARASTFYIHPTTYLDRDRWNAPICEGADCGEAGRRALLFVRSQASAFSDLGPVWAPRYRQAAYGAFLLDSADAHQALDFAYADVKAAFAEFLSQAPADKPIILAAHSQGALHLSRLLREERARIGGRLVAAYVVGWPLSATADLPAIGLPACGGADEAGCLLSWQSFAEPANPALILDAWEGTTGPGGARRDRKDMLCVNPVSGTRNGVAAPADNPGTLVPSADLANATLAVGQVGARCADGLLLIDGAVPAMGPYVLPGNNYHVYDYALFWGAIRRDAARRLAAWTGR